MESTTKSNGRRQMDAAAGIHARARNAFLALGVGDDIETKENATREDDKCPAGIPSSVASSPANLRDQRTHRVQVADVDFNPRDQVIRDDIVRAMVQYLQDEGFSMAAMTLQDEANVRLKEMATQRAHLKKMKREILEGDWAEVGNRCSKSSFRYKKAFLYSIYLQQYLELVDSQEYQKAFALLTKRLKPLESYATNESEFRDVCYLLTCKSVSDAESFKDWAGAISAREELVKKFDRLLDFESQDGANASVHVPPSRLRHLLHQAVTYQVDSARYHPKVPPRIETLLDDYQPFTVPNAAKTVMKGHRANVKCVTFLGTDGSRIATGSSDNTVMVWDSNSGARLCKLEGHTSRVWGVVSDARGSMIASGSGDGTVRLWKARDASKSFDFCSLYSGHDGDVYSVALHPQNESIVAGGYDKVARLYDLATGQILRSFRGHDSSISTAIFNPYGNIVITGSKDQTIKFWDVLSGLCVNTLTKFLGEVTSVETNRSGNMLLTSSKDNSNRLWDLRMNKHTHWYKGHQNTSKSFVRTSFGPKESLIIGGSEDGMAYLWDIESGAVVQTLGSSTGVVYSAKWNAQQSLLATCGHDGAARTWWYDDTMPLGEGAKDLT